MFSELPSYEPTAAIARSGMDTGKDKTFVRQRWEVPLARVGRGRRWVPFAKGGDYCKYYYDLDLVVDWGQEGRDMAQLPGARILGRALYFREGLTYPRITVKGFNVRILEPGAIISHAGGFVFFDNDDRSQRVYSLAFLNSNLALAFLSMITDRRKWEIGYLQSIPFKKPSPALQSQLGYYAQGAHDLKAAWDTGNESCTRFDTPWLIQAHRRALMADIAADGSPLTADLDVSNLESLLDHVRAVEQAADARLQSLQARIDEAVYDLYEISPEDRALIERELGDRPPEVVWPQMEGKADKEKPYEHVRRLISYFLLQALKEKRDGILPLTPGSGYATALDEVRGHMEAEFGEMATFRMEAEIRQVLGRDIASWLDGPFIRWHTKLYKKRPVIWHLASPRNAFACFVYIHRLDRDTLRKVQTLYLWPQRRATQAELEAAHAARAAGHRGAARRIDQAEATLEDLAEFENRLLAVIQGEVECDIPDWAAGPYCGGVYNPVLDDGVKVNITPLQEAEVLRYRKLV